MPRRYFVAATVLASQTDDDTAAVPAGHTAVTEATIRAAYPNGTIFPGGTWDGTTYTPPDGQVVPDDLTTDTGRLRAACRGWVTARQTWREQLNAEGAGHDAEDAALGHTYLARGDQAVYLAVHNHRTTGQRDWTVVERIAICQGMSMGAADVVDAFTFFAALYTGTDMIGKPTGPVLWLNPNTGVRVNLESAITTTSQEAHLDVTQLPAESIIDGGYIDSLTA